MKKKKKKEKDSASEREGGGEIKDKTKKSCSKNIFLLEIEIKF